MKHGKHIKSISDHLRNSMPNFLRITQLVQDYLYEILAFPLGLPFPATSRSKIDFINTYLQVMNTQIVIRLVELEARA